MAGQLRTAQTIATPTPLMQIRVNVPTRQLPTPREGCFRDDRQAQRRLEVLHRVEARLRAIRREVDEQQQRSGDWSSSTGRRTRESMSPGGAIPDVLGDSTIRGVATQTETVFVVETQAPSVVGVGSEDSNGNDDGMDR